LGEGRGVCEGDDVIRVVIADIICGVVVLAVVVTYYRVGRLEAGQLAPVVVEAMFVQGEGRLGRHSGGG
jgi:hypothetical protein